MDIELKSKEFEKSNGIRGWRAAKGKRNWVRLGYGFF